MGTFLLLRYSLITEKIPFILKNRERITNFRYSLVFFSVKIVLENTYGLFNNFLYYFLTKNKNCTFSTLLYFIVLNFLFKVTITTNDFCSFFNNNESLLTLLDILALTNNE